MVFGEKSLQRNIVVNGILLQIVEQFTYLGCNMTHDLDNKEILIRIARATVTAALKAMDKIWKSKAINWRQN